ncbi:MAG: hypothetical protein ACR2H2_11210 [Solirubrobacteraceae bacterium]
MSAQQRSCLSGEEVMALKFAAHRQLARWANKRDLTAHQRGQRAALKSAVGVLQDHAFSQGCELCVPPDAKESVDG